MNQQQLESLTSLERVLVTSLVRVIVRELRHEEEKKLEAPAARGNAAGLEVQPLAGFPDSPGVTNITPKRPAR